MERGTMPLSMYKSTEALEKLLKSMKNSKIVVKEDVVLREMCVT
jgi:hypothetical protein